MGCYRAAPTAVDLSKFLGLPGNAEHLTSAVLGQNKHHKPQGDTATPASHAPSTAGKTPIAMASHQDSRHSYAQASRTFREKCMPVSLERLFPCNTSVSHANIRPTCRYGLGLTQDFGLQHSPKNCSRFRFMRMRSSDVARSSPRGDFDRGSLGSFRDSTDSMRDSMDSMRSSMESMRCSTDSVEPKRKRNLFYLNPAHARSASSWGTSRM